MNEKSDTPRSMERDRYYALSFPQLPNLTIADLWRRFPELVVGNYLVNTSFDSGFLTLAESERSEGWHFIGNFAHSPRILSIDQIPHDQYDEWLIFGHPTQITAYKTMVNHIGFTPLDPEWDDENKIFWDQIIRLQPLHVLGENAHVYVVSRDSALVQRIKSSFVIKTDT